MLRNSFIVLFLWVLSLVGISFFGGPITYGFFYFMTFIPLSMLIYLLIVYFRFKVYQNMQGRYLVANHIHPFLLTLQNESYLVFSSVRVNLFSAYSTISGSEKLDGVEFELMPHTGIRNESSIVCRYRGVYQAGIRSIEIRDCLKLFRFTYKNPSIMWVIVKPDLIRISELKSVDLTELNAVASGSSLTEPDILVRKYVPGDDPRFIHWKSSARVHELMTRTRTGEEQPGITFLLSTAKRFEDPALNLPAENKMLETLLALGLYFVEKGTPITMEWFNEVLMEKGADSVEQFNDLYEEISTVVFSDNAPDTLFLAQAERSRSVYDCRMVFMVLQEWTAASLSLAEQLNRSNIPVVVYLINDDPESIRGLSAPSFTRVVRLDSEADLKEVL